MAATVYDIAEAAGVSRTTVLRVLWNNGYVSAGTKARVLKVAEELKYKPNTLARGLTLGRSTLVGVLAGSIDGASSPRIVASLHEALRGEKYSMLFSMSSDDPKDEEKCIDCMISNRVPGALIVPATLDARPETYQPLLDAGIPVVVVDRLVEGFEVPTVVADQYMMGRLPTEHLIALGHERIVHLAMPGSSLLGRERTRGFVEAMRDAGVPVDASSIMEVEYGREAGERAASLLLEGPDVPTAVVARNDLVAAGVIAAVSRSGLSVPDDMSVTGAANYPLTDLLKVPLTTVQHPTEELVSRGMRHLLDMIAGEQAPPVTETVDVRLILRESCARPRRAHSVAGHLARRN
jgi:DNA-binding LacI/PurR family transcriptional regulator